MGKDIKIYVRRHKVPRGNETEIWDVIQAIDDEEGLVAVRLGNPITEKNYLSLGKNLAKYLRKRKYDGFYIINGRRYHAEDCRVTRKSSIDGRMLQSLCEGLCGGFLK